MIFEPVDSIIDAWAVKHGFVLFREFGGLPARFIYMSSERECCQIWIEPPLRGDVIVHARDVETVDDEEVRMDWKVLCVELATALDDAFLSVKRWFAR